MEKHTLHPADSGLMEKLLVKLAAFMQSHELSIRQTYTLQGPRLAQQVVRYANEKQLRYANEKQFRRMCHIIRMRRTWVGRLYRELKRQLEQLPEMVLSEATISPAQSEKLLKQRRARKQRIRYIHCMNCLLIAYQRTRAGKATSVVQWLAFG